MRPGGRLAILEVDAPTSTVLRTGYDMWFDPGVVPVIGGALSDREAYEYLPRSVAYLPPTPLSVACSSRPATPRSGSVRSPEGSAS